MTDPVIAASDGCAIPVLAVTAEAWPAVLGSRPAALARLAEIGGFKAKAGQLLLVHDAEGEIGEVLFGLGAGGDATVFRGLSAGRRLPAGARARGSGRHGCRAGVRDGRLPLRPLPRRPRARTTPYGARR
jgi:leucyl aminopeptidase